MGQLIMIQQPARVSRMGALPSGYFDPGGAGHDPAPAPAPGPVSTNFGLNNANSLLMVLDSIANPEAPQKMTATGVVMPTQVDKARTVAKRYPDRPYVEPAPQQPPQGYDPAPGGDPDTGGAGGGGGGGGAAPDADAGGADEGDAPVFLGLTQKQLMIGGAVALGAWLLLRKKHGHASSGGGVL